MKKLLLTIGIIALTCACQQTEEKEMTIEQREEVATIIKQQTQKMFDVLKVYNKENFEIFMDGWIESDDAAWMNNPALWLNMLYLHPTKEEIYEAWKPSPETRTGNNFNVEKDYVAVLTPEHAVYVFQGTYSVIDKDGNKSDENPMSGTYVFILKNDEWKLLHIHQSWIDD